MSKHKLTLSIDENLIKTIKHICIEEDTTMSELFENYIKAISKNKNTIRAVEDISKS